MSPVEVGQTLYVLDRWGSTLAKRIMTVTVTKVMPKTLKVEGSNSRWDRVEDDRIVAQHWQSFAFPSLDLLLDHYEGVLNLRASDALDAATAAERELAEGIAEIDAIRRDGGAA